MEEDKVGRGLENGRKYRREKGRVKEWKKLLKELMEERIWKKKWGRL